MTEALLTGFPLESHKECALSEHRPGGGTVDAFTCWLDGDNIKPSHALHSHLPMRSGNAHRFVKELGQFLRDCAYRDIWRDHIQ